MVPSFNYGRKAEVECGKRRTPVDLLVEYFRHVLQFSFNTEYMLPCIAAIRHVENFFLQGVNLFRS